MSHQSAEALIQDVPAQSDRKIRLFVLTTIGKSIQVLYEGRLEHLASHGFEITAGCAPSDDDAAIAARGVRLQTFPLTRAITPWPDLRAVVQLYRFFRRERFDLVEVSTPKAALVGSVAAWLARCPCQIHILHGMAYQGKRGLVGWLLRLSTAIPCRLARVTFAVSPSVRDEICADGLGDRKRIRLLGAGSANGVDLQRFSPEKLALNPSVRAAWNIPLDAVVIGFVGRMTRDKGVMELVRAFVAVHARCPGAILLMVGAYEERDHPPQETVLVIATHPGIRHVGWQADVLPFMTTMDVFVLPTHREGLGNVLLEAAALGIPTVTTNATGARDASVDGRTGLQVPVGDEAALTVALETLMQQPALRHRMGTEGREWVCQHFDQQEVWRRQTAEYRSLAATYRVER